jgi:cytochrome oxidase complex assembly protein 1
MNTSQRKGWFGRNWKWFIPAGCLSIVAAAGAVVAAGVYFVFGAIKSSDVYQQALTRVRSNPAVVRELGEPIEPGWLISGSINVSNDSGNADVRIPVSGPKKSGAVYATAIKKQDKWDFSALEVEIEGETKRINLLAPSTE